MTMKESPNSSNSSKSTPTKPHHHRYLKPGALAKLRDSKITARNYATSIRIDNMYLSQLSSSSPTTSDSSPIQNEEIQQNHDNMVPSFDSHVSFINRPVCIARKKLFAVPPVFTPHTDTYPF
uniref:Uncharacterized protein LOC101491306 n=1 Tax=Cicer arietinum TaxID=3827 RepID=A0A1S2XMN8_CICAR|nr:uncharacterized protein LOC101491306 [Cicer arietinum]